MAHRVITRPPIELEPPSGHALRLVLLDQFLPIYARVFGPYLITESSGRQAAILLLSLCGKDILRSRLVHLSKERALSSAKTYITR